MSRIKLLLVDDHPVVRNGLKRVLATQSDFTVVGEAETGREAVAKLRQQCPDIVIMDISMPDLNGIEAARQVQQVCPATQVIMLTMHSSQAMIARALQAGAKGYLLKGTASSEVIPAVRSVYSHRRYLSKKILEELSSKSLERLDTLKSDDRLAVLSPREREVLQLVAEGQTSAEIAETLYLSVKTIETYRHRLMQKLNINDIPTLVKFAIQQGVTPLD